MPIVEGALVFADTTSRVDVTLFERYVALWYLNAPIWQAFQRSQAQGCTKASWTDSSKCPCLDDSCIRYDQPFSELPDDLPDWSYKKEVGLSLLRVQAAMVATTAAASAAAPAASPAGCDRCRCCLLSEAARRRGAAQQLD